MDMAPEKVWWAYHQFATCTKTGERITVMPRRSRRNYDKRENGSSRDESPPGSGGRYKTFGTTAVNYTRTTVETGVLNTYGHHSFAGYGWQDPYETNGPGLIQILYPLTVTNGIFAGGVTQQFETSLVSIIAEMPNMLYAMAGNLGLSITSFFTATLDTSFTAYCDGIINLYSTLRMLQAAAGLFGINNACNAIAENLLNNKASIEARIARLEAYPFPKSIYAAVDKMVGVFITGNAGDAPLLVGASAGTFANQDLSSQANLTTLFTNIDTVFGNIASINATDFGNIMRLLSYLYPISGPFGDKPIHTNAADYYMHFTVACIYWNTTSLLLFSSTVSTGAPFKLYAWGDVNQLDPLWGTLFRPTVYYNLTGGTAANTAGRGVYGYGTVSGSSLQIGYYRSQTGVFTNDGFTGAAARVINIAGAVQADWDFPNASIASQNIVLANILGTDFRCHPGYNNLYPAPADTCDATAKMYQEWFFGDIVGPRR
jgi:hypothetical protein